MIKDLQATIAGLFKRDGDPLGAITPEQLKAVLKSIEGKYNALREDNRRLKAVVEEQREALARSGEAPEPAGEVPGLEQIEVLSRQIEELSLQRDAARSDRDTLAARLEQAATERDVALARLDEDGPDREALLARIDALESSASRVTLLESELAEANEARATAMRLSDADAEKLALRAQLAELQEQLAGATGQQDPVAAADSELLFDAERAELERAHEELQGELLQTRQERDRLQAESDELRQERDRLQAESKDAGVAASDAHAEAMQIAELKLQAVAGQKADLAEQLAVATRRNAELEDQLVSAAHQKTELKEQFEAATARIAELTEELAAARSQIAPREDEEGLREEIERLQADLAGLRQVAAAPEAAPEPAEPPAAEREMLRAIAAIAEQVERLSTCPPASAGYPPPKPSAVSSRSRPRPRKPASPDDPARKLDWLMGV